MNIPYVLGYYFNRELTSVTLIYKRRPEWQAGKLNGVGGHIEKEDVSALKAMEREFYEETGATVMSWREVHVAGDGKNWTCHIFTACGEAEVKTQTDETVWNVDLENITKDHLVEGVIDHIQHCMNYYEKVHGSEAVQCWERAKKTLSK